ncbi:Oidioi.mRNA.OKI2018_I69.PAR.g11704.t1.cds [Oikopleura dioica]|uniref:Oidioi.mRNA.OKI2018_I69.PAR.g11704.t1.cds n=1 Tax=Oikopleura dioica TaxID=34765 RepID=A0ABN7RWZ5_OIKDI|nr:Oidioi.mRNA.OKI2018_I69.PAR.g11704.t1.cds [Oikopleura dioica]
MVDKRMKRRLEIEWKELQKHLQQFCEGKDPITVKQLAPELWKVSFLGPKQPLKRVPQKGPLPKKDRSINFNIEFPEDWPCKPPLMYSTDREDYPYLLPGNHAPFDILKANYAAAMTILFPILGIYFLINGNIATESNAAVQQKDNRRQPKQARATQFIPLPSCAYDALRKIYADNQVMVVVCNSFQMTVEQRKKRKELAEVDQKIEEQRKRKLSIEENIRECQAKRENIEETRTSL